MNRKERRRRAKLGDIGQIRLGRVKFEHGDEVSGACYVCGKPATAWPHPSMEQAHGAADIDGEIVLLCETCFNTPHIDRSVIRKSLRLPDLQFEEGGEISMDELHDISDAIKERGDKPTN